MRTEWRWAVVLLGTSAVDLAARFGGLLDFPGLLRLEAVLFPAAALALAVLLRREPPRAGWARMWRIGLIAALALGGLRAGLWSAGVPVPLANATVLVLALAALAIAWLYRQRIR